jgi:hypothetical protein
MLRVVVIGPDKPVYTEADAAEIITPGHIVQQNSAGKFIKNTVAANSEVSPIVAVENDIFGKGIDDNWAVNDRVYAQHLRSGCEFMGIVAAAHASAINYNDPVTTAADGTIALGTAANMIGRARSAVAATPGTPTRIRVLVK